MSVPGLLTIEGPRLNDGPSPEAFLIAQDMDIGSHILIIRKGPLCLFRYDACEYEVQEIHGCRVPWLKWVTFGFTKRSVLRKLCHAKQRNPNGH